MNAREWYREIKKHDGGMVTWSADQLAAKDAQIFDLASRVDRAEANARFHEERSSTWEHVVGAVRKFDPDTFRGPGTGRECVVRSIERLGEDRNVLTQKTAQQAITIVNQKNQIESLQRVLEGAREDHVKTKTEMGATIKQAIENKQLVIDANARQFRIIETLRKQLESHGIYPAHLAGLDATLAQKGVTDECANRAARDMYDTLFAKFLIGKPLFHVHSGFDFGRGESWTRRWWCDKSGAIKDEIIEPTKFFRSEIQGRDVTGIVIDELSDTESAAEAEARETESLAHKVDTLWREHTCGPDVAMTYRDLNGKIAASNKLQSDRFFSLSKQADVHEAEIRHARKSRGKMHGQIDALEKQFAHLRDYTGGHDANIQNLFRGYGDLKGRVDIHGDVGNKLIAATIGEGGPLPEVPLVEQIEHVRTDLAAAEKRGDEAVLEINSKFGRLDTWKENVLKRIESLERHRAGGTVG